MKRILAAILISVAVLPGCGKDVADDPREAVEQFLLNGAVGADGVEACRYLTPSEQHAVSRAANRSGCAEALNAARLVVGGQQVATDGDVQGLSMRSSVEGDRATVRVSGSRSQISFRLVKADAREDMEFEPPDTEWRIASGAGEIVRRAEHAPKGAVG